MRTVIVPMPVQQSIDEIVREGLRLPYTDVPFRHMMSKLLALQKAITVELPGMESTQKSKARATLDELRAYCVELGLPADDGDGFYDKMLQTGWKVNKQAVRDVFATIRNWKRIGCMPSQIVANRPQRSGNAAPVRKPYNADKELASLKRRGLID